MTRKRRSCLLWVLACLGLLGIVLMLNLLTIFQAPQQPSRISELLAARQRWQQRPVQRYALELERNEGPLSCFQSFELSPDNQIEALQGDCRGEPWSVERMFDEIEQHLKSVNCAPNGCTCGGRILVEASYDPQFGYPTHLRYTSISQFDPLGWISQACYNAHPRELPSLTVTSFQPIQP
jgi:hypothetical protein